MSETPRELLARTGRLFTQEPDDVGHISDFWRGRIVELCDLLDSAPLDIADQLMAEKEEHARTRSLLKSADGEIETLERYLSRKDEEIRRAGERSDAAVRLVEDAVPRMRTLNNAMSPDWLRRADEFLGS